MLVANRRPKKLLRPLHFTSTQTLLRNFPKFTHEWSICSIFCKTSVLVFFGRDELLNISPIRQKNIGFIS